MLNLFRITTVSSMMFVVIGANAGRLEADERNAPGAPVAAQRVSVAAAGGSPAAPLVNPRVGARPVVAGIRLFDEDPLPIVVNAAPRVGASVVARGGSPVARRVAID